VFVDGVHQRRLLAERAIAVHLGGQHVDARARQARLRLRAAIEAKPRVRDEVQALRVAARRGPIDG
jgi:hypothetical protein